MGATIAEYRTIIAALRLNGMILKGEMHEYVTLDDNGAILSIRHKPEIHAICEKYNLYQE
jgi:hypothetical protein